MNHANVLGSYAVKLYQLRIILVLILSLSGGGLARFLAYWSAAIGTVQAL